MKINLARSAGFCFGVKRALSIAFDTAKTENKVFMLGDIVHNEDVVREVEKSGIKKIKGLGKGKNKTLLIRAHGSPISTFNKAIAFGYKVIDATCPMVKEIQKTAQEMEKNGYKVIVIGDKKHDEVQGIIGQLKTKAIVIDNLAHIPLRQLKNIGKAAVVVQSTQNLENVIQIVNALRQRIKELKFCNTICNPTRRKQEEIKIMPKDNEVMVIIGSRSSANTKRLYEISKALNNRSYWVSSKDEIKKSWFKNIKNVGVTAGASTPDSTTQDIITSLRLIRL